MILSLSYISYRGVVEIPYDADSGNVIPTLELIDRLCKICPQIPASKNMIVCMDVCKACSDSYYNSTDIHRAS